MGPYPIKRMALSLFRDATGLAATLARLDAIGIDASGMVVVAAPAVVRQGQILGARTVPKEHLVNFAKWMSAETTAELAAAVDGGEIVLLVEVDGPEDEQAVSQLLLNTSALRVQLHDMGD